MRGSRAKSIRRYVKATFPFLPTKAVYTHRPNGVRTLIKQCARAVTQGIKSNYLRKKRGLELKSLV